VTLTILVGIGPRVSGPPALHGWGGGGCSRQETLSPYGPPGSFSVFQTSPPGRLPPVPCSWLFPSFHPQEFFSVAWTALTVVTQAGHKKRWNMLAAAGLRGMVRLLHVRAGFCCSVIRAHKKAIATLCFSPSHETHLFSKTLTSGLSQQPFFALVALGTLLRWRGSACWAQVALLRSEVASWPFRISVPALFLACYVALKFPNNLGSSVSLPGTRGFNSAPWVW
jgi:hypothetical protein